MMLVVVFYSRSIMKIFLWVFVRVISRLWLECIFGVWKNGMLWVMKLYSIVLVMVCESDRLVRVVKNELCRLMLMVCW